MSWLFSQALVAEYSADTYSDGKPCAQLNMNRMPQVYLCSDKMTGFSRLSRFGMTFGLSTADSGQELLMWYLAGFPVKTSALPDRGGALMEAALDSGQKWHGLLVRYDHNSYSWKTAQLSLLADSDESLATWPRSGMTRNGCAYLRQDAEHTTSATESGFWPTPRAMDGKGSTNPNAAQKAAQRGFGPNLSEAVGAHCVSKNSGDGLATAVARDYPTPTATAYKGWSPNHNRADTDDRLDYTIERQSFAPGQQTPPMRLNPQWVEWLMGWPLGWTDLKPLAMAKFQEWRQQHLPRFTHDFLTEKSSMTHPHESEYDDQADYQPDAIEMKVKT